jgi:hypothetical protein
MRLTVFTSKAEIENYKEAESTPPQHSTPWQWKALHPQHQKSKEAQNQPLQELRKVVQRKLQLPPKVK